MFDMHLVCHIDKYNVTMIMLHYRATPGGKESPDTKATIKGLKEGVPYEFRVAAVNEAGPGEWAECDEAIKPAPPPC